MGLDGFGPIPPGTTMMSDASFRPFRQLHSMRSRQVAAPNLTEAPLTVLRDRLRRRELQARELVEAHIAQIQAVNPALNAVVIDRFAAAREEAQAADARLQAASDPSTLPPLLGIPCTVKEFFAVAGQPQTGGMVAYRDRRPAADSTVVERLRQAGAIIVGLTNVPEGGMWMETWNKLYGRTQNPWNLAHTSGGSSGGEGAIVGAGGAVFGIGSDIGGSVRIPAAFCGTVGHKPSGGLIPLTGHFPENIPGTNYLCAGPLCRRVGDVMPILRVLSGPDGHDPDCRLAASTLGDPGRVELSKVRVLPVPEPRGVRTWPVMQAGIRAAAAALGRRGAQVLPPNLPDLGEALSDLRIAFLLWSDALTSDAPMTYDQILSDGAGVPLGREFLRLLRGQSRYIFPSLMVIFGDRVSRRLMGSQSSGKYRDRLRRLHDRLDALLGDDGVLIYPTYSRPAPRHYRPLLTPHHAACTALFNALGYPSTVVPLGLSPQGLPLSVQVIGRHGQDHLTLGVAQALEDEFGGWLLPPSLTAGTRS
jgi:fatty acid amide hydrolase 2